MKASNFINHFYFSDYRNLPRSRTTGRQKSSKRVAKSSGPAFNWAPSKYWVVILVAALLFVYFMPWEVLYADSAVVGWGIYAFIFFVVPALVYVTTKAFVPASHWPAFLMALSPLIVGPTFGLWWEHRVQQVLQQEGDLTRGVVSDRKKVQARRGEPYWQFRCEFTVAGITYWTEYKTEGNYSRAKGDTLEVIYCRSFPQINEIGYLYQPQ